MNNSKFNDFIDRLLPGIEKFQKNLYLSSIMEGMMTVMPVLVLSAIFQVIYSLPITPWVTFLQNIGLYDLMSTVVTILNSTALFMAVGIGYTITKKKGCNGLSGAGVALACFLIVTPLVVEAGAFGNTNLIDLSNLGAQGVFTAMIVSIIAPSLYCWAVKKNLVIKMPESVPAFVSTNFASIPPAIISALPFVILRGVFAATPYGSMTQFIYTTLQTPLVNLGNSLPGHLIAVLVCCFLWWLGIHGTLVVLVAVMAIFQIPMVENINAVAAGLPAPNVLSYTTWFNIIQFMGGPGALFGLCICMAFFAKSERYKVQGKISLIPGILNIIEPTVYGVPVVLNPILLAPFILYPVIVYVLYYILASAGIIGIPTASISIMVMPGFIGGFLAGGGISYGIFLLLAELLSIVVYYPFFKVLDNQALKDEQANAETE